MVRLVIEEPTFKDSSSRCFKLPFVAQEALMISNDHVIDALFEDEKWELMSTLFSFVRVPEETQLNSTLCGYFNKILSFWILKKPEKMVEFMEQNVNCVNDMIEHIYHNASMVDILIRICCIKDISDKHRDSLH